MTRTLRQQARRAERLALCFAGGTIATITIIATIFS